MRAVIEALRNLKMFFSEPRTALNRFCWGFQGHLFESSVVFPDVNTDQFNCFNQWKDVVIQMRLAPLDRLMKWNLFQLYKGEEKERTSGFMEHPDLNKVLTQNISMLTGSNSLSRLGFWKRLKLNLFLRVQLCHFVERKENFPHFRFKSLLTYSSILWPSY